MSIKQVIASAGKNLHTVLLTAREEDGSVETREAEPYSYRFNGGHELFFCYDIGKQGNSLFRCYANHLGQRNRSFVFTALAGRGLSATPENLRGSIMVIKKIHPPKPPKPIDRLQNMKTVRPIGKTKWVKAHWRWDYNTRKWEWVLGHWSA